MSILGEGDRGMDWDFGVGRCKLLHLEWINNKVLLHSTGSYIRYPVIKHNRILKKKCSHHVLLENKITGKMSRVKRQG